MNSSPKASSKPETSGLQSFPLEMYARVLESMTEGVSVANQDGFIVYTNSAQDRMFGYERNEILGRHVSIQTGCEQDNERKKFELMLEQVRLTGAWTGESQNVRKDGVPFVTYSRITAIQADTQEFFVWVQSPTDANAYRRAIDEHLAIERQLRILVDASTALLSTSETPEVISTLLDLAGRLISADAYAVWRYIDGAWRAVESRGLSPSYITILPQASPVTSLPNEPFATDDVFASELLAGRAEVYRREGIRSLLTVPLRIHGQISGTIVFYSRQPRTFTPAAIRSGSALANLASSALGMAELHEHQTLLRNLAEASERRSRLRADIGQVLASSMDMEENLRRIAELTVPAFADWMAADFLQDGVLRRAVIRHYDSDRLSTTVKELLQRPSELDAEAWRIALRGEPVLFSNLDEGIKAKLMPDPVKRRLAADFAPSALIVAPMTIRGTAAGVMLFGLSANSRSFTASDVELAGDVGRRVAIALDNSRLFADLAASERRFRTLADGAPVLIWLSGKDRRLTWFNKPWLTFVGKTIADEVGEGWLQNVHPADLSDCSGIYNRSFDHREPFQREFRLRHHSGEWRWVLDHGIPFFSADGDFSGYVGSCTDITEIKTASEALRISQKELASVLSNIPDVISRYGPDLRLRFASPAIEKRTGRPPSFFVGKSNQEALLPDEIASRMDESLQRVFATGASETLHFDVERPDGVRHYLGTAIPELDSNGAVESVLTITRDVTPAKQAEDELRRTNEELLRVNDDLNRFAYSASHDLQEPLRMISLYNQLLERRYGDKLDEKALEFLQRSLQGAMRLETLIKDLLSYTQAVNIKETTVESVDTRGILDTVLQDLDEALASAGATVHIGTIPNIRLHPVHVTQLLQNLLTNAIKYRSPDVPLVIDIDAHPSEKQVLFRIRDNGLGISKDYHDYIFELFKRLHTASRYPGTGIGLALCRKIVERYGGRIWVESQEGRGSSFYFKLPG